MLGIFVQIVPPSEDDSQYCTVPTCPVNVRVPVLAPLQTVVLAGFTVPPTDWVNPALQKTRIAKKERLSFIIIGRIELPNLMQLYF